MLTVEVTPVFDMSITKPRFIDHSDDYVEVPFPDIDISPEGRDALGQALTIQSIGWKHHADEVRENNAGTWAPPPRIEVILVPGGNKIDIEDGDTVLTYKVGDQLILTERGASGLREALQDRVRTCQRVDAPGDELPPDATPPE